MTNPDRTLPITGGAKTLDGRIDALEKQVEALEHTVLRYLTSPRTGQPTPPATTVFVDDKPVLTDAEIDQIGGFSDTTVRHLTYTQFRYIARQIEARARATK